MGNYWILSSSVFLKIIKHQGHLENGPSVTVLAYTFSDIIINGDLFSFRCVQAWMINFMLITFWSVVLGNFLQQSNKLPNNQPTNIFTFSLTFFFLFIFQSETYMYRGVCAIQ